jgi:hypothetical protein
MNYYAGIDVLLECSSVCVVDGTGKIAWEAKPSVPMMMRQTPAGSLPLGA